ncbi:MAG: type I-C CRISPR-associated protein Cas8c/Csd1 [Acidobacteriota bacterium]|nr:type I-C CRISPR-associated protein Cas8c/Csd1 [Blastocatellia bacterium]MDW8241101.1 type I-C CRISPR-associated protein Cas8c/Csd1 [Acidobacteriota bacterium]
MLLQQLRDYSERLELPPPMYLKTPITWLIELDVNGNFRGFVATEGKGGKKDRGKEYLAPHVARSSGVRAKLLADTGEYVLGIAREKSRPERVEECHRAFVDLVRTCAKETNEPSVAAVLRFLESADLKALQLPGDFDPGDVLTFRVDGVMPIDLPSVKNFWASFATGQPDDQSASKPMQCLICGELRPAVKRLPIKIKRIPGGQTSGMAIISANVPAFESYGLEASLIAPTCQDCGERFSKAANELIENEQTHITIGPIVYLFWTKQEHTFSFATLLSSPEPGEVKALMSSAFGGKETAAQLDTMPFYATAFSASGGRVAVREWLDTTVEEAKRNLARYFALQRIVERDGTEGKPLGLYALASSTVRDASKELPPNVPKALLHVALKGGPLPMWLLFQAVKRNRAEQGITRPRAALIKMVLRSQQDSDPMEETMIELDTSNRNPAYLCGRLLALLEAVQRAAIPGANTTITDRFFGTASSAPASVFGRLLRGAQAHLGKLRREKPGTHEALQRKLEEVQAGLTTFPKTLTLEEQGLFSLGYYHQRAADRAAAIAYKQSQQKETA